MRFGVYPKAPNRGGAFKMQHSERPWGLEGAEGA